MWRCHDTPAQTPGVLREKPGNVNQGFHLRNINQRHQFVFITMGMLSRSRCSQSSTVK